MSTGLMVKASLYVFAPVIMTKAAIPVFQFHYRKKNISQEEKTTVHLCLAFMDSEKQVNSLD